MIVYNSQSSQFTSLGFIFVCVDEASLGSLTVLKAMGRDGRVCVVCGDDAPCALRQG